jgi:hypothetical protein
MSIIHQGETMTPITHYEIMVVMCNDRKEGLIHSTFFFFNIGPVSEQIMLLQNIGTSVQVSENQVLFIYANKISSKVSFSG